MVRQRVRLRFRKEEDLRLIGHRDLVRTLERLFRRAELRLSMSEGFHPKPRMSFPSALAVGIAGTDEVMELELVEMASSGDLLAALAPHAVPGLSFTAAEILPPAAKKAQVDRVAFELPVPAERCARAAERIAELRARSSWPLERPGRAPLDLLEFLEELALAEGVLRMRLRVTGQENVRPREVLEALDLADLEEQGSCLTRTAVELRT
ncbi:MAG: TIGR03936 family radical SAM-associated protein [Pirellulales bacterium]